MTSENDTGTRPGDTIVARIGEDGVPTTDMETAMWTHFLNGTWQREKPTSPGVYPLANNDGKVVGDAMFSSDCKGNVVSLTHSDWDGWFFSTPMPRLPNRPPKKEEEKSAKPVSPLRLVT